MKIANLFAEVRALARAVDDATRECVEGWLVTDAAAEGEWTRVRTLLPEAPSTPAMRLFAHLAGDDASARLARASAELCLPFQLTAS